MLGLFTAVFALLALVGVFGCLWGWARGDLSGSVVYGLGTCVSACSILFSLRTMVRWRRVNAARRAEYAQLDAEIARLASENDRMEVEEGRMLRMPHPGPMSHLSDLFPIEDLDRAIAQGLVARREHPGLPLVILNYTERCQYEPGLWSPVTKTCRGLIYNRHTLEIVARPFPKFFNHGEREAPAIDLAAPVAVTDKLDGSLGILCPSWEGEYSIATRGAFTSDQALHATEVWHERYARRYRPPRGVTPLFEIIFPGNRIVCDYGDLDDLVLLGGVDIETGQSVGPRSWLFEEWPGPRAQEFEYATFADALAAPPRPGAEGLVVHVLHTDERVKIKQEDYVLLHRIISGLNERAVWEHLSAGKPMEEMLAALPDEFHDWTRSVAVRLLREFALVESEIEGAFWEATRSLPDGFSRKEYALAVKDENWKGALFSRLDGKDYSQTIWKALRPSGAIGPRAGGEVE
jgi:RNA ligase